MGVVLRFCRRLDRGSKMKARPKVLIRPAAPHGLPRLQEGEPPALAPALRRLELAKDRFDTRFVLDDLPASIYGTLAAYVSSRPARFNRDVIEETVRVAGADRLMRAAGKRIAANVLTRFSATVAHT